MIGGKRLLLAGGCARSGTTALFRLLNAHPEVMIGMERYLAPLKQGRMTRAHFERQRFLEIHPDDTQATQQFDDREQAAARFDRASIIGDKLPAIWMSYPYLWDVFPEIEVVYILRNPFSVAESYIKRQSDPSDKWRRGLKEALSEWNESVTGTLAEIEAGRRIVVVRYDLLFANRENAARLFEALGLNPEEADTETVDAVLSVFEKRQASGETTRSDGIRHRISMEAAFSDYRTLINEHCILTSANRNGRSSAMQGRLGAPKPLRSATPPKGN